MGSALCTRPACGQATPWTADQPADRLHCSSVADHLQPEDRGIGGSYSTIIAA